MSLNALARLCDDASAADVATESTQAAVADSSARLQRERNCTNVSSVVATTKDNDDDDDGDCC